MFVKGEVTNPNGRPVGSKNKATARIREMIDQLFLENLPKLQTDIKKMKPAVRAMVMAKFAKFSAPSLMSMHIEADPETPQEPDWAKGLTKDDIQEVMALIQAKAKAHGDSGGVTTAPGEAKPS